MFLLGNYQHSLDDKNRIRLPSNFRKELGKSYFLMPGANGCIHVYKADETQEVLSSLLSLESLDPEQSLMLTKIAAFSRAVTADDQGRFMLPDDLIEMVGIKKDVRIVGAFTKAQIWSEEAWQEKFGGATLTGAALDEIYRKLDAAMKTSPKPTK